ncbi:hypothetical protein L1787_25200 [Acuticoccus sp. M5D2P5]|uniref:hypothetical protein n=1 Tax=Acuticoccus kalidii TaxID=2910977 RepID=UPI001F1E7627|nr:hypothetical protein [Acuticoccus kalidii]MCF3936693.1 hypothetical protein [Acuticoccus kalidii]
MTVDLARPVLDFAADGAQSARRALRLTPPLGRPCDRGVADARSFDVPTVRRLLMALPPARLVGPDAARPRQSSSDSVDLIAKWARQRDDRVPRGDRAPPMATQIAGIAGVHRCLPDRAGNIAAEIARMLPGATAHRRGRPDFDETGEGKAA